MRLGKDLREFIESLNSHGVEYVIVGAYALAYHGSPRYTGDLDGIPVQFIGRQAFLKNKRATGRLKDRADLEALGEQ